MQDGAFVVTTRQVWRGTGFRAPQGKGMVKEEDITEAGTMRIGEGEHTIDRITGDDMSKEAMIW